MSTSTIGWLIFSGLIIFSVFFGWYVRVRVYVLRSAASMFLLNKSSSSSVSILSPNPFNSCCSYLLRTPPLRPAFPIGWFMRNIEDLSAHGEPGIESSSSICCSDEFNMLYNRLTDSIEEAFPTLLSFYSPLLSEFYFSNNSGDIVSTSFNFS